jgi:hypothetical protein
MSMNRDDRRKGYDVRDGYCPFGNRYIAVCYAIEMLRPCLDALSAKEDNLFFIVKFYLIVK